MEKKWIVIYREEGKNVAVISSNESFVEAIRGDVANSGGFIIHNVDVVLDPDEAVRFTNG